MLHHVSIPARDPEHVAKVLAELLGGYAGPFVGPIPGAWVAYAEDAFGTGIEVYSERTQLVPGQGDEMGGAALGEPAAWSPFHALISVKADRASIERIGVPTLHDVANRHASVRRGKRPPSRSRACYPARRRDAPSMI